MKFRKDSISLSLPLYIESTGTSERSDVVSVVEYQDAIKDRNALTKAFRQTPRYHMSTKVCLFKKKCKSKEHTILEEPGRYGEIKLDDKLSPYLLHRVPFLNRTFEREGASNETPVAWEMVKLEWFV